MTLDIQITDEDLPVLSVVATQALELLRDPEVANRQIDELIRQDPALTQRVLHVANSPFYCGRVPSQSIHAAITRLGLRQLRTVITMAATGELFDVTDPHVRMMWEHSVATAIAATTLVHELNVVDGEEAFIAGMLHDVGKLVIYRQYPESYRETIETALSEGRRLHEVEAEQYRLFTHMSIGGLVVRKWSLPDLLAEAVRFHHEVETEIPPRDVLGHTRLVCVVALANMLVASLNVDMVQVELEYIARTACCRELGVDAARLQALQEEIEQACGAQLSGMI